MSLENGVNLKFKFISENTLKIVTEMLKNQNLLKYIYYLDEYDDPLQEKDVSPSIVFNNNIRLSRFNESILSDTKIMLFFCPINGRFKNGKSLSDDDFLLDIVIPNHYWLINKNTKIRAFEMAREIATSIDQQRIAGIGYVEIIQYQTQIIGQEYQGISMILRTSNASLKL